MADDVFAQLEARTSALIIIDMQNAFVHDQGTLGISGVNTKRLAAITPAVRRLAEACNAAGIPVIWTIQEHFAVDAIRAKKKLAGHTSKRKQVSALAGSWDEQIIDELKDLSEINPSYVIRKHRFGAFYETRLQQLLRMLGTQTLMITGTTTNACVETTIREAYLRDYDVVAITDCISGVNDDWEQAAQKVWNQYFGVLSDSAAAIAWMQRQSQPRTLGFGHVLLKVADIKRSEHFYGGLLGFTPRSARPLADGRPFTPYSQGLALTAGLTGAPKGPFADTQVPAMPQVDHMAFQVNDVRGLRERLKAAQVPFQQDLHDGPYGLTIYVSDPDGNRVELYEEGAKV